MMQTYMMRDFISRNPSLSTTTTTHHPLLAAGNVLEGVLSTAMLGSLIYASLTIGWTWLSILTACYTVYNIFLHILSAASLV